MRAPLPGCGRGREGCFDAARFLARGLPRRHRPDSTVVLTAI